MDTFGKSRSKRVSDEDIDASSVKRSKTSEAIRLKHIGEIKDDIQDISDRISFNWEIELTEQLIICYVSSSHQRCLIWKRGGESVKES